MKRPWIDVRADVSTARALETELRRELPSGHVLAEMSPTAIARREDRDDVLFDLGDGRYAVVHLTYQEEVDDLWPNAIIFASWPAVNAQIENDAAGFASEGLDFDVG